MYGDSLLIFDHPVAEKFWNLKFVSSKSTHFRLFLPSFWEGLNTLLIAWTNFKFKVCCQPSPKHNLFVSPSSPPHYYDAATTLLKVGFSVLLLSSSHHPAQTSNYVPASPEDPHYWMPLLHVKFRIKLWQPGAFTHMKNIQNSSLAPPWTDR